MVNGKTETTDSAFLKVLKYIEEGQVLKETQDRAMMIIEEKNKMFFDSLRTLLTGEKLNEIYK